MNSLVDVFVNAVRLSRLVWRSMPFIRLNDATLIEWKIGVFGKHLKSEPVRHIVLGLVYTAGLEQNFGTVGARPWNVTVALLPGRAMSLMPSTVLERLYCSVHWVQKLLLIRGC